MNNYKQALQNISTLSAEVQQVSNQLQLPASGVFEKWHAEELKYLQSLKDAPTVDSLEVEYVETLQKLNSQRYVLDRSSERGVDVIFKTSKRDAALAVGC